MVPILSRSLGSGALHGVLLHGQSDNLTAVALVARAREIPTETAVRWTVREPLGLPPNGATLYRRAERRARPVIIAFENDAASTYWLDVSFARVRGLAGGAAPTVDTGRGLRVDGSLEIGFARPVVEIRAVLADESDGTIELTAIHFPFPVAQGFASVGTPAQPLRADLIDALLMRVPTGHTAWIARLEVIPLAEMAAGDWERVLDLPTPGSDAQIPCRPADTAQPFGNPLERHDAGEGQMADAMRALFDTRLRAPDGGPLPMAQRLIDTGSSAAGDPTVTIPALAFLLLSAVAPDVARGMGLLLDVKSSPADSVGPWDYLLVGHWCPRRPLGKPGTRADLHTGSTDATPVWTAGELLLDSPGPIDQSADPAAGGLALHDDVVWIHFPQPVQAVELELADGFLEATAFAGQRVVDWALSVRRGRATLCADEIYAVALYGPGVVVRAVVYAEQDPALDDAPAANVGDVGFWMFAARDHGVPRRPQGVTVEAVDDPTSHPEARQPGEPEMVLAAVSWNAEPLMDTVQWTEPPRAAQYLVTRGTRGRHQTVVAGGHPPFVVLPSPESLATSQTSFGAVPPAHPCLLDRVRSGSTLVYGVRAVDIFGRASAEAFSPSARLEDRTPPPPPDHVEAAWRAGGAVDVTWEWPGAEGDPDALGFRVYWRTGGVRRWADGTVSAVQAPAAGSQTVVCDTSVGAASVGGLQALVDSVAIVGGDRFLVKAASAIGSGSSATLRLELRRNPSTPDLIPAIGDTVRIFGPPPASGTLADAANFDGHVDVADRAARSYTIANPAWSSPDEFGRTYITVGVATYDAHRESPIAGPAQATALPVLPDAPPRPAFADEADVFATRADVRGRSSYAFTAVTTPGATYHVYRALDEGLLRTDSASRAAGGTRTGAPANPAPLAQQDFDQLAAAPPGPAPSLTNRALHALANFAGSERAFEQLTEKPVAASGATITYVDELLPGTGANRYVYRLRAASLAGELGDFGWAYPPVRLWPQPPTRPTLARVEARGPIVDVEWSPSPESAVDGYRVYVAMDEQAASDERTMTLVAVVSAGNASGDEHNPNLGVTVRAPQGARYWFRVTSVATYSAPVNQVASAPSAAVAVVPQTYAAPLPPAVGQVTVRREAGAAGDVMRVSFAADENPTTRYQLARRPAGSASPAVPVSESTPPRPSSTAAVVLESPTSAATVPPPTVELTDEYPADTGTPVEYVVVCSNESGRRSTSDPIPS